MRQHEKWEIIMKIYEVTETATVSGSMAVAVKTVGKMQSRTMYNADGTMKNALDGDKLMAGKKKSKKNKQA